MAAKETEKMTIEQVADALGLSKTTVSRALSGKGRISEETRTKVYAYMGRTRSEPVSAQSGEKLRTNNIAMVVPQRFIALDLPFLRKCMGGICTMADQRGYDLMLCYASNTEYSQLQRQLANHKVDGVILTYAMADDPCIELLRQYETPFVLIGRSEDKTIPQADNDQVAAACEMTRILLQLGAKRIALVVIVTLIAAAMLVVQSNYALQAQKAAGKKPNNFRQDITLYLNEKFYVTLLTLPVLGVVVFTIIPLFILIAVAFTNYDQQHMPPAALFTWVGLANFASLFGGQSLSLTFSYAFGRVLSWTLVWAFFATFTNFFGGVFLAMLINNKKTKCQKLWRTLFIITIAVPQFVTLLLVRNFFSDAGIFNTMMANAGVTDFLKAIGLLGQNMNHIPFLTDQHWAKFMIILINIWVGVPYQMLIATGVLMNIPTDMLEASTIDGASPWQSFIHIKLPYLLSVQGPALVTDFVRNVNNFNVIYLLTQDVYITKDQALASSSAKEVDLLVTWLFRLTQEQYNYKMAAVIGIMVFIICAVFTLVCFRFLNKKEATFS